jgi:predicted transcriptional regulator
MNVILSIKPIYAEKILSGEKRFEYRKVVFKQAVTRVYLYASFPVCRIVGEFFLAGIISDSPNSVWRKTKKYSGVDLQFFNSYFKDKKTAHALHVSSAKKYKKALDPKTLISGFRAPQSFCYVEDLDI